MGRCPLPTQVHQQGAVPERAAGTRSGTAWDAGVSSGLSPLPCSTGPWWWSTGRWAPGRVCFHTWGAWKARGLQLWRKDLCVVGCRLCAKRSRVEMPRVVPGEATRASGKSGRLPALPGCAAGRPGGLFTGSGERSSPSSPVKTWPTAASGRCLSAPCSRRMFANVQSWPRGRGRETQCPGGADVGAVNRVDSARRDWVPRAAVRSLRALAL